MIRLLIFTPQLGAEVVGGFTGTTAGPLCIKGSAAFEYFRYEER